MLDLALLYIIRSVAVAVPVHYRRTEEQKKVREIPEPAAQLRD